MSSQNAVHCCTPPLSVAEWCCVGPVNFAEIIERDGKSQGWGLVEMSTANGARTAIQQLDGQDLAGRIIEVT